MKKKLSIPAEVENLDALIGALAEELKKAGCPREIQSAVCICAEEIFVNISSYAYPEASGMAFVEIEAAKGKAGLLFTDNGLPFNPLEQKEPERGLALEDMEPGGLGIFFVRSIMDRVTYKRDGDKNCLYMEKKWKI